MRLQRSRLRFLTLAATLMLLYAFHLRTELSWPVHQGTTWARFKPFYPIRKREMSHLPAGGLLVEVPRIQHAFNRRWDDDNWDMAEMRRREVKKAFQHAWDGYKKRAWGWDELLPLSGGRKNTLNGWGVTIIDNLDTLWIMDMKNDFHEAVRHVAGLDFNVISQSQINLFETNIRYLGGLISAYDLSGEPILLEKALELGNMLYAAFDTPSHMPTLPWFKPTNAKLGTQIEPDSVASADLGTLSLEFTRLTQLTGDSKFYDAIDRIKKFLLLSQEMTNIPGMWPARLNTSTHRQATTFFTIGAEADSLYEYLPKMYLLLEGKDKAYQTMWLRAATTIQQNLLFKPITPKNIDVLFSGAMTARSPDTADRTFRAETGHLDCFAGGMFALAGKIFDLSDHVADGVRLATGCAWAYSVFPTGLMPESVSLVPCKSRWEFCKYNAALFEKSRKQTKPAHAAVQNAVSLPEGIWSASDRRFNLRPEAIESLFVGFRTTGQKALREMAWEMFEAVGNATTSVYGNAAIGDVMKGGKQDVMEVSFFFFFFFPY